MTVEWQSRPPVATMTVEILGRGLTAHLQPSTSLQQGLAASRRLRQAREQVRRAHQDPNAARTLIRECSKYRVGLRATVGAGGIPQLTMTHLERATAKLRYALEQQQTAIATVLLQRG